MKTVKALACVLLKVCCTQQQQKAPLLWEQTAVVWDEVRELLRARPAGTLCDT